jgi:hypothetical protein
MEYTLKLQDKSKTWFVTFQDSEIKQIYDGQQAHTLDSPRWKSVKRYVENLMIEHIMV